MMNVIFKISLTYFLIVLSSLSNSNKEIEITANSMEWKKKDKIAIATGNAKAIQGSSVLSANKIIVFFNRKNDKESIEKLDASGRVKFIKDSQVATGDNAVYYIANEKIFMKGNVALQREDSKMLGDELTIDLKTSTSKLTSNKNQKVRVKYNTEEVK